MTTSQRIRELRQAEVSAAELHAAIRRAIALLQNGNASNDHAVYYLNAARKHVADVQAKVAEKEASNG